jgi:hypothetical protein
VYQENGKRYYLESGMIDRAIEINQGTITQNDKYSFEINDIAKNGNFSVSTGASTKTYIFDFQPLSPNNEPMDPSQFGYMTLRNYLSLGSQIYLTDRASIKTKAIIFSLASSQFIIILPTEVISEFKSLDDDTMKSGKIIIDLEDLGANKIFIEAVFDARIYQDLLKFKENLPTLLEIYNSYTPPSSPLPTVS